MILDSSPERKLLGKSFNLNKLISTLAENYNTTAYHNFTHAFSLLLVRSLSLSSSTKPILAVLSSEKC